MMTKQEKTIVRKIEWFNNESEMILTCDLQTGALSYSTQIAISGTLLNQVLSNLQKQQTDLDLNDFMRIEQFSEDEAIFVFDFTQTPDLEFQFVQPREETNLRKIRA